VVSNVGTQNQVRVNWTEPSTNGDAISNYYVTMSGGNGPAQIQTIPGTVRTATFAADNSEAAYAFTVQAENKAGKGAVSQPSAPRRATGKLATVSGVTATPANTAGAGRQLTVNFNRLTAAERNGSADSEVSYSYNASNGASGPVVPGQTIGGFANGSQVSITVIANSAVAPSSNASTPAAATPFGNPGTPAAGGQNGALNDQTVTLSWSSPSTSTNDVAVTKIRISPGGGWESVAPSGSRTINTGGWQQSRTISVQTFNSLGTASAEVSATATSGRQGLWETKLTPGTGLVRSCTYTLGGANYRPAPYYDCDGINAHRAPWLYTDDADRLVVRCYIIQSDHWTPDPIRTWYRIESGSTQSVGRYVVAGSTTIGEPSSSGVPPC
jgi:hypothetical protein